MGVTSTVCLLWHSFILERKDSAETQGFLDSLLSKSIQVFLGKKNPSLAFPDVFQPG
jgi:hypothetical protein